MEKERAQPERITGSSDRDGTRVRMPVTAARFERTVYWNWGDDANTFRPETPVQDALPSPLRRAEAPVKRRAELDARHEIPQTVILLEQDFEKPFRSWTPGPHSLRHARHAQRCLAGVMIHLCGSRSTRRPIVSFHFIPTGVRLLHLGGGARGGGEGVLLFGCQVSRFDLSGRRSF